MLFMQTDFVRIIKLLQKDLPGLSFHIKYGFIWEPFSQEWVQFLEVTSEHWSMHPTWYVFLSNNL